MSLVLVAHEVYTSANTIYVFLKVSYIGYLGAETPKILKSNSQKIKKHDSIQIQNKHINSLINKKDIKDTKIGPRIF